MCPGAAGSAQSSTLASRVAGSCGSGTSSSDQPCAANSARRPRRTASARDSSPNEVKKAKGVLARHSSPMNTIAVKGERR